MSDPVEMNKAILEPNMSTRFVSLFLSKNNPIRAAFLFGFASLSSWMPMFNLWLSNSGLNGIQIGYIAAIPWLLMIFVLPLWGIIADKYGKLLCLKFSLLCAALLFLIFPFASHGLILIVAMTIILSIFNTPVLALLDSIVLDQVASGQIVSYSNIRFWGALGYGIGAIVTGWLIPYFGVKVAFFSSAGFLLLTYLSAQGIINKPLQHKGLDIEFKFLGKILSDKILLIFIFIVIVVSIGQSAITFFLTLYMREIGASPETTGTAIGMEGISELPFYFVAAWLLQRLVPGKVVLIAIFATCLRLFLYSINSNPNLVILIESMNGLTWTLLWVASVEFVNSMVPAKWRTTGQSLLWAAYYGAGAVTGNIASGWLYQHMPMKQVYAINSLMILLAGIMAIYISFFSKVKQTIEK